MAQGADRAEHEDQVHPFYFGPSQTPLFGVYHEAHASRLPRGGAVVLCHPLGHEYIRVHRAFRNLAADLSVAGWHVLRFDYYGTGDSAGNAVDTRIARCVEDVNAAIDELKDMCGANRVSLVGLRLGATLAAMVSSARPDIDTLVAWDPVCKGSRYVAQMRHLHRGWLKIRPWMRNDPDDSRHEAMGFPLSPEFERELNALDISTVKKCRARRACLVLSGDAEQHPDIAQWRSHVDTGSGRDMSLEVPALRNDWEDPIMAHRTLLPREALDAVLSLLEESRGSSVPTSARNFPSSDH